MGCLLGVTVDLDDGVVHVDHHQPRPVTQHRRPVRQSAQEPGGDRIQLTDVTEGERPQKRTQRRRGVAAGEHPAHPAVPQQGHVVDRIRPRRHARHQRRHLQPSVRALVGRHRQMSVGQLLQTRRPGQPQ